MEEKSVHTSCCPTLFQIVKICMYVINSIHIPDEEWRKRNFCCHEGQNKDFSTKSFFFTFAGILVICFCGADACCQLPLFLLVPVCRARLDEQILGTKLGCKATAH